MTRWFLAEAAALDLEELTEFLMANRPDDAVATTDLILEGLAVLQKHPLMGRPAGQGLREMVISRGRTGYLALYDFDAQLDVVVVLAVRHQREQDYH